MAKNLALQNGDKLFIDADAFIAMVNPTDSNHRLAVELSKKIADYTLFRITSNFAAGEAVTVISQDVGLQKAISFGQTLFYHGDIVIVDVDRSHQVQAFQKFSQATSKNVRFTDCINIVLMEEFRIHTIFSFDKHYKQAGFTLLGLD